MVMCWNKEVSLATFVMVLVVSYCLWVRNLPNDRLLAVFIMAYGTMQLLEAGMWAGLKNGNCTELNRISTKLACVLLYLHPLALTYAISVDSNYPNVTSNPLWKAALVASIAVFLYGMYRMYSEHFDYCTHPHEKYGHLMWDIPNNYASMILPLCIIICLVFLRPLPFLGMVLVFYLSLLAISVYYLRQYNGTQATGAYWCWLVAFFAFILYFLNPYLSRAN